MRAAQALGRIGSAEAVPKLIGALDDPLWTVRRQAAAALVAIGQPAVPALAALVGAAVPNSESRISNLKSPLPGLSVLHAIEALGRLHARLPDSVWACNDWAVRGFAAATLTDTGRLRTLRRTEQNPFVLSRMEGVLETLEKETHEDRLRR